MVEVKTDSLIRTKLHLPFTRQSLVTRSRLQARVLEGLHGPLTLVIAPAGFGKSTLAASSVTKAGWPVAWLSLDQNDNQVGRFLTYLVAAFRTIDERIGDEAGQLLQGAPPAPSEAVLTSLINNLDAAPVDRVLVLDDYQFMTSPAVHSELTFLIEHSPRTLHLLLATRSDPPLPLARWRARSELVELRAADLRFSVDEAGQFLNDVMHLRLDAGAVAALERRTEGWIAGLQMAALSMLDREDVSGFIAGFSGTNRFILDYLLEEVLAHQPPETQRFLLVTSILDRLAAPLCDALLAVDGEPEDSGAAASQASAVPFDSPSQRLLDTLERDNLFLTALDDGRTFFRYHALFADLLKARLHQLHPALAPRLHRQASAWLEEKGYIPEAIQHLLAIPDASRAADLIERYGPERWARNDLSVMQMADSLPYEMLVDRPRIGANQAWLWLNEGEVEKAYPLLKDLAQRLEGDGVQPGQRWIHTVVHLALIFLTPPAIPPGSDALPEVTLLDEIPSQEAALGDAADVLYGMTLGRRGEYDHAVEFSIQRIQAEKLRKQANAVPSLVPFLATIYLFQGRLHAAVAFCQEYLDRMPKTTLPPSMTGNLDVVIGNALYEWNRLDEGERVIRDGLQANEPWSNIMTDAFGLVTLADILQAKGDYAGAMRVVETFEARLQTPLRPVEFQGLYHTLRIQVQLASGDLQAASRWADSIQDSEDFRLHPERYRLTLARVWLAQRKFTAVEKLLKDTPDTEMGGNRLIRLIDTQLILAVAAAGQQQMAEAMQWIDSCLAMAEPEGYRQVFLSGGEPVRQLLAAYLREPAPGHKLFAQKLLGAYPAVKSREAFADQNGGLIEPLSSREREVLSLMALGRTNQDIARQLVVAPGTIKAHAASIYRKLDVANRTEAIARARELGLLP